MSFYKLVMLMKAEKKRQDIINAAMELFKEHGFDQVSVDDICERLDISKPTLYKYINVIKLTILSLICLSYVNNSRFIKRGLWFDKPI